MINHDRDDLVRMREAFSAEEWQRAADGCPDAEELWSSAVGELERAADKKILLHLVGCSECSSIWRLAREMISPDDAAATPVISIGDRRFSKVIRRPSLLAAAAALLIGVGLAGGLLLNKRSVSPPVYRQQQDDTGIKSLIATQALPRADCRLKWSAGPDGTRYDLVVTDGELEILSAVKGLRKPEYFLPEEMLDASLQEIFWRVTAHLPDQRSLVSETFTTRIDDRRR